MPPIPPQPRLPRNGVSANIGTPSRKGVSANIGGGSSGDSSGGSDWQHLLVRGAEFIIGVVLVWVGIQAIVVKSKPGQTIIQTTGAVAKVAAK
jgi:hypothetical protein